MLHSVIIKRRNSHLDFLFSNEIDLNTIEIFLNMCIVPASSRVVLYLLDPEYVK
jgi:hypothetical protein